MLGRDPHILKRQASQVRLRDSPVVSRILEATLGSYAPVPARPHLTPKATQIELPKAVTAGQDNSISTTSETSDGVLIEMTPDTPEQLQNTTPARNFDFGSLMPPEVWNDLMPVSRYDLVML